MTQVSRKGFRDKNGKQVAIVPKVPGATSGNLASFDAEGNLQDSGKKPADFAEAGHSHSVILDASAESSISIDEGIISIAIEGEGSGGETEINGDNISNLHRALEDPVKSTDAAPTYNDHSLITSGAVKAAIDEVNLSLSGKEDAIPLIGLKQAADETNWEPTTSYDSIYTAACSWGKTRPVLVRFLKIDTFDVTLIGTLSANFNSADGTAVAVICAGGYKFVRTQHSPASSIEELIWDNGGVTQTAISL